MTTLHIFPTQFVFDSFFLILCNFECTTASGLENDLNYFELPMDVNTENRLNEIDGRPSADETVCI